MTSIDPKYFVRTTISEANRTQNDFEMGWNHGTIAQQYKFDEREAWALTNSIEKHGWFADPMLPTQSKTDMRAYILEQIHALQTPEASKKLKGSISLTFRAAQVLNNYAKELGLKLHFDFDQKLPPFPLHAPVIPFTGDLVA